ncbi:MAG: FHA domain-containing protein, partial [Pirellulaceae bacterium]
RAKDCHMRPKSDSISRNHCAILTKDDRVVVRDLNSRNGTLVNGEKIQSDQVVESGDRVRVGKLEFEMIIEASPQASETAAAPEKEEAVQEASAIGNPDTESIDFDVSEWLDQADAVEVARRQAEPDTRQFQLDETDRIQLEEGGEEPADAEKEEGANPQRTPPKKQPPGKLPDRPSSQAATSRDAAADMLKKFFDNR